MKLLLKHNSEYTDSDEESDWLRKPKKLTAKVNYTPKTESTEYRPQIGPQEKFLNCSADVVFYGGAAGGGKSWAMIYDMGINAMRFPDFTGAIFRRTTPMITNPGGMLSETQKLFPKMGGILNRSSLEWVWPNNARIKLAQLQYEDTVEDWQSAQLAEMAFDELTQFTRRQFFFMLSRLRSTCGIIPYVRAGCNPDPTSWVREFISWWLGDNGYPIPERSGIVRWFAVEGLNVYWADDPAELIAQGYANPLSFTFIPAKLDDNGILMKADPSYKAKLDALNPYDRALMRDGNWSVSKSNGMLFTIGKIGILDVMPTDIVRSTRYWDRAATEPSPDNNDPDWTAGVRIHKRSNGRYLISDVSRFRKRPEGVQERIKQTAKLDGMAVEIGIEQDPGSAGVSEADYLVKSLAGHAVYTRTVSKAKFVRAKPLATQVEAGNVDILAGPWNSTFLQELDLFVDEDQVDPPPGYHDDQVDGASGGFNLLEEGFQPFIRSL